MALYLSRLLESRQRSCSSSPAEFKLFHQRRSIAGSKDQGAFRSESAHVLEEEGWQNAQPICDSCPA